MSAPTPDRILLDHGEGGAATSRLVQDLFLAAFHGSDGPPPYGLDDAAVLPLPRGTRQLAMTTDSFVVQPLIFPGGDIGKLAICGTVNDLAVSGAEPRWLSCGFILEEGLELSVLRQVVDSMAATAREAGIQLVAGDTKVVSQGEADGIYINTSGVGLFKAGQALSSASCRPGDQVLVSGTLGDHGTAVMVAREGFGIEGELVSDCQPLADLAAVLHSAAPGLRCMRDPTRGGLATTLWELARASGMEIRVQEAMVPLKPAVRAACDLLGLDPLFVACEGRLVAIVPEDEAEAALQVMRAHPRGRGAAIIGAVMAGEGSLLLETAMGGRRPLAPMEGAQLPRIC